MDKHLFVHSSFGGMIFCSISITKDLVQRRRVPLGFQFSRAFEFSFLLLCLQLSGCSKKSLLDDKLRVLFAPCVVYRLNETHSCRSVLPWVLCWWKVDQKPTAQHPGKLCFSDGYDSPAFIPLDTECVIQMAHSFPVEWCCCQKHCTRCRTKEHKKSWLE